jgi:hypothetical protein
MGHGVTGQQGVGPGNGPREWDDVEAEAHRCSDSAAAWGADLSSGEAPGPAHEDGKWVRWLGTDGVVEQRRGAAVAAYRRRTRGAGTDTMQRWWSPLIGMSIGSDRTARGGG